MAEDYFGSGHQRSPLLQTSDENSEVQQDIVKPRLSRQLCLLFGLNGATLAFPMTALLYILNTRVSMPLNLISVYAAISFLPFSLQPLYANFSNGSKADQGLYIVILLLFNALSVYATSLTPQGGVATFIVLGFLRGITSAWSEFLFSLNLIAEAKVQGELFTSHAIGTCYDFNQIVSQFQAQAATCRNLGTFAAQLFVTVFLAVVATRAADRGQHDFQLTDQLVSFLLVVASLFGVAGSAMAWFYRFTAQNATEEKRESECALIDETREESTAFKFEEVQPAQRNVDCMTSSRPLLSQITADTDSGFLTESTTDREQVSSDTSIVKNVRSTIALVLLQTCLIFLVLKNVTYDLFPSVVWVVLVSFVLLALTVCAYMFWRSSTAQWKTIHGVGLFLILRHAIPSSSLLLNSYIYFLFQTRPDVLQFLSLVNMGVSTLATWTFDRVWLHLCSKDKIRLLLAGTTTLAALVGVSQLLLTGVVPKISSISLQISLTILVKFSTTMTGEWAFLPDVILASTTAGQHLSDYSNEVDNSFSSRQFGTLLSCINFGDQLGALLEGPLVTVLQIRREENWAHLDRLIKCDVLFSIVSIALIFAFRIKS